MVYYLFTIENSFQDFEADLCMEDLGSMGFESFERDGSGIKAYIPLDMYDIHVNDIRTYLQSLPGVKGFREEMIPDQDWNAVWESQYEPVRFGDFCFVRAPFHSPVEGVRHDVVIEPKMSFGTAHHPTTSLMIQFLQEEPPVGKRVLDMGCGTGVLGIIAAMQGAVSVTGIDIDQWAFANAVENVRRNGFPIGDDGSTVDGSRCSFRIGLGTSSLLENCQFDVIYANINRNILVNDMSSYASCLPEGGVIYLSGFYLQDMDILERECNSHRLFYQRHLEKDQWAAMKFIKK